MLLDDRYFLCPSPTLLSPILSLRPFAQWSCTIKSKVDSTWNLHSLLPHNLDFFILLSSLAGVYGSTSQCNYSAGNTFQDALAKFRMKSGFSGSSIAVDLGWMHDVGIIAERKEYRRHREKVGDMGAVYAADLLALLDHSCGPGQSPPNCAQES
ncbi:KR domain-containing protein [Ustulina deusta]|nr:KR domain-containing protein [Ustulina deusta]